MAIALNISLGNYVTLTRKRSQALANVQSYLHERVAGVSVIKSFALEEVEQKRFDETNDEFLDKAIDHTKWNAKAFAVVNTITDVAPLLVLAYAGYQVINGDLICRDNGRIYCIILNAYIVHFVDL